MTGNTWLGLHIDLLHDGLCVDNLHVNLQLLPLGAVHDNDVPSTGTLFHIDIDATQCLG